MHEDLVNATHTSSSITIDVSSVSHHSIQARMLRGTAGLASSSPKDLGRRQYRLHSTSSPQFAQLPLGSSTAQFANNPTLWSYIHSPPTTRPRNHLLLVRRPGRQPFSKRQHAQARIARRLTPSSLLPRLFYCLLSTLDSAAYPPRVDLCRRIRSCRYYRCYCIAILQYILHMALLFTLPI
jgi:hypothetical protein